MKIGIISGNIIENLLSNSEKVNVETSFGDVIIEISKRKGNDLFFINRHGESSDHPPHKINYLANIQALSSSKVECIFAMGTVGSMKKKILPGEIVIPHDFIDLTKMRHQTYFDKKRIHVDMTHPYCLHLRNSLIESSKIIKNTKCHEKGIYLTTEGPRLETASEINMYSNYADIVGMTGGTEAILSREKGICYASLCIVCNMAAGLQDQLDLSEIISVYNQKKSLISEVFQNTVDNLGKKWNCNCQSNISKASL
jgi:5'-methylthioadenosine phosphorylase